MKNPTIKQKAAFNETLKALASGKEVNMKSIMKKAGYSKTSLINPGANLTNTSTWKEMMDAHFDDEAIAREIRSIAFDEGDKRAKLVAIDMMLKLKGKYPINKLRLEGATNELNQILNVDETTGGEFSETDKIPTP